MDIASVVGIVAIPIMLFMFMLPIALLVALQVWLCKKSVKLGLILPGISLGLSLLIILTYLVHLAVRVDRAGPRVWIAMLVVFLVTNIPTIVFGGIWLHYKGRRDT